MTPGQADRLGIGYDTLSRVNPALVYCSVTGFGPSGPFAEVPADDGLAMAKAGILRDQPGWDKTGRRPVYRGSKDASYFSATFRTSAWIWPPSDRTSVGR